MKHTFRKDRDTAVVTTRLGKLRGYEYDGLTIFKGIPYAQARRFHAPEPVEPWEGVKDVSSYGCVCPLMQKEKPDVETFVPHRYWPMDEHCQNLNIWTPGLDGARRPVAVWLHGGGYFAGSAIEQAAYDGAAMARLGDAVVVTVNHRLNLLGYFDLSDFGEEYANSGNAGGDDIVMALRWVHEFIALFGGDPDNVTVFGQSGGGAKVTTLLQTPAADGLYQRGMVMSGVIGPVLADAKGSGRALAEAIMARLGLRDVHALEEVPYEQLSAAYLAVRPALMQAGEYVGCCPHPNQYYLGDPVLNGFRPETAHIPLLVGSVFGEFASFSGIPFDRDALTAAEAAALIADELGDDADTLTALFRAAYPERHVTDLLRLDTLFRQPGIDYIRLRGGLNDCTWSYLFNMDQPIEGGNTPWHCSDIPYVFHNIDLVEYPHGPQADEGLSARMEENIFRTFMAFCRTGNPNNPLIPDWPASKPEREQVLLLDAHARTLQNFDHALIAALTAARAAKPMRVGSVAH